MMIDPSIFSRERTKRSILPHTGIEETLGVAWKQGLFTPDMYVLPLPIPEPRRAA